MGNRDLPSTPFGGSPAAGVAVALAGRKLEVLEGEHALWTLELPEHTRGNPFRDARCWTAASVVAVGAGQRVDFHAIATGAKVASIALGAGEGGDGFGQLAFGVDDTLYVLGWRDVTAVAPSLAVRWVARDVAVDGIVWRDQQGPHLLLSAEMDPPGGWVDVILDVATGRRITP
jgi:hypothetical protein